MTKRDATRCQRSKTDKRICRQCGSSFYTFNTNKNKKGGEFCSLDCWYEFKRPYDFYRTCEYCGQEWHVRTKVDYEKTWCSNKCSIDQKRVRYDPCQYCGDDIPYGKGQLRKFCSKKCANSYKGQREKHGLDFYLHIPYFQHQVTNEN